MGYKHFNKVMRMELSILRKKGYSTREIANELKINQSSVVRELKRNSVKGQYDPQKADHKAYRKRKYSKYEGMKIRKKSWLERYIKGRMKRGWTPEQISGRLEYILGESVISFKIIYKWIYSVHGHYFAKYLPSKRSTPRKRKGKKKSKFELIPNRVFIDRRPDVINKRGRFGDFEGDTLGKPKHSPETLVGMTDRKSRFFLARKASKLKHSMEEGFKKMTEGVNINSLTLDNGVENVRYESLGVNTYFCHPYSSWEKPTIENTFGRLRRWIFKGSKMSDYSDEYIASIVKQMNNTPRKCLGFRTPAEVFKDQFVP